MIRPTISEASEELEKVFKICEAHNADIRFRNINARLNTIYRFLEPLQSPEQGVKDEPVDRKDWSYCQRHAEEYPICDVQCDHCKAYYAPLEKQSRLQPSPDKWATDEDENGLSNHKLFDEFRNISKEGLIISIRAERARADRCEQHLKELKAYLNKVNI